MHRAAAALVALLALPALAGCLDAGGGNGTDGGTGATPGTRPPPSSGRPPPERATWTLAMTPTEVEWGPRDPPAYVTLVATNAGATTWRGDYCADSPMLHVVLDGARRRVPLDCPVTGTYPASVPPGGSWNRTWSFHGLYDDGRGVLETLAPGEYALVGVIGDAVAEGRLVVRAGGDEPRPGLRVAVDPAEAAWTRGSAPLELRASAENAGENPLRPAGPCDRPALHVFVDGLRQELPPPRHDGCAEAEWTGAFPPGARVEAVYEFRGTYVDPIDRVEREFAPGEYRLEATWFDATAAGILVVR